MAWMIGIDTGGTFTDVVALNTQTGEINTAKVPSTPDDPSRAVLNGVEAILALDENIKPSDIQFFSHGTTVATNAVIERKGSSTGLLLTKGTRAVYETRKSKQLSPREMLNPRYEKPPMLVPQRKTKEIGERIAYDGSVIIPLDVQSVKNAVRELVNQFDVKSIAVCYLFSFMNSDHEKLTKQIIEKEFPEIKVSLSCDLLPVIREYPRLSTTVLDAFVGPVLETYLRKLELGLRQRNITTKQVFIMQSNGGLMSIDVASSNPVQTLMSGPAAGVITGLHLSQLTGFKHVVTFDVGGTSTDIAIISNGVITESTEGLVAGQDCAAPMNEISTIGAGGGTIARVGKDGLLKVGPDSSGAKPGPACYNLGGKNPTVTDADLVLGYLDENSFLGGKFHIYRDLAYKAIEDKIAKPLNLTVEEAAYGIKKIVNSNMEVELRLNLLSRGFDPRSFALVAFGGAGPVHASIVAKNVGIKNIIVPPYPGLGSAMGLLLTDIKHNYLKSHVKLLSKFESDEMSAIFQELLAKAHAESQSEGVVISKLDVKFMLDMRYVGQGYELTIPCSSGNFSKNEKSVLMQQFNEMHQNIYGHSAPNKEIEIVNFRLVTLYGLDKLVLQANRTGDSLEIAKKSTRKVYFEEMGYVETPVYAKNRLPVKLTIRGPAIIEQVDSTIVITPEQTATPDEYGNVILKFDA